ncbi:MAG: 50S ribosomal protein L16 [Candidatus Magasanikbacteria bacterium GW2011_GWC2_40_17]|uniref:Large ribosomal subunit protein uL16 n=1 Tax=Candidatus Magasanikbacteria bacterium GW2011_GWA2_42_32 TaxID=1619039 RepID=A0A0G1A6Y7_9BACT|nr:MAG: 50S ribosomal protein L16 [Candidatus Magasanikbacteria bacterium GW2011_GWC2_40_17]KKS56797.1 MAG: 50S ribosomal protein L16 [Candidatus Magasanikbacteria bacterium GW2011_GWA2_42_32]OGH86017.1 MAG: 50S ribosomal protein L16 [Candidatus Magasanikbacteria bacterium RIFOXYB2_FULL_38_10]
MLFPKKVKHRKWHKGRRRNTGIATAKNYVAYGSFGLKSLSNCWIDARQIEAARRTITRYLRKGGKVWIRIFPDKPVTNHGNESVMGGGKGAVDYYVAPVKPGTILFEVDGVDESVAKEALHMASYKLPVKCVFVKKV